MDDPRSYYAPTPLGLEEVLAGELRLLGAGGVEPQRGGVAFTGDRRTGYAVCVWSRVAVRVLEHLAVGTAHEPDDLYRLARTVDWSAVLPDGATFAIFATAHGGQFRDDRFAAFRIKDAIVDQLRERRGHRPDVDAKRPDIPLRALVRDGRATLSRDLAGGSLHRRGWRPKIHKAAVPEHVAAGLLQLAGWDRRAPLVDPMCGSGTFLIEAAHAAADRAPGIGQDFAFFRYPDLDERAWHDLRDEARRRWKAGQRALAARVRKLGAFLQGNDRHPGAIALAEDAARRAGVPDAIRWTVSDVAEFTPDPAPGLVVSNPPYGLRIGEGDDLERSWRELGHWLKRHAKGADAWLLSGEAATTRALKLKAARKVPVSFGGLDARWLHYPMH